MLKRKKLTVLIIAESVLLGLFIAAAILVAVFLRPVSFTASDGTTVQGWSWAGTIFVDAGAFKNGMDAELDTEGMSITYTEPVDPELVRAEAEEALVLKYAVEAEEAQQAYEDSLADLEAQLAESKEAIAALQAQIDELVPEPSSNIGTSGGGASTGGGGTTQSPSGTTPTPSIPSPSPAPAPPAPAAPSVDAGACILAAIAYGQGLGMTFDPGLSIGNSGYMNPPDITVLSQENVIGDLYYCLDSYLRFSPDDPAAVHFNIVQSGNLIYALYQ